MPVRRHKRNGRWRCRATVTLADGTRRRIFGTPAINTKAAALAAERAHIERALRPEFDQAGKEVQTLRAFVPEFMETYVRANNKRSERMSKESLSKHHLLPAFGRKRLDETSTRDVKKLKAEKLKTLQPKTVNDMLSGRGKMLRYAAECEVIDRIPRIRFVRTMESAFDHSGAGGTCVDHDDHAVHAPDAVGGRRGDPVAEHCTQCSGWRPGILKESVRQ